jgi:hypothetical protein
MKIDTFIIQNLLFRMSCKAYECRFPATHTTLGHRCGRCGDYGHGVREHDSPILMTALMDTVSANESMPLHEQCDLDGCLHKISHNRDAHHCRECSQRGHTSRECIAYIYYSHADIDTEIWNALYKHPSDNIYYIKDPDIMIRKKYGIIQMINPVTTMNQWEYRQLKYTFITGLTLISNLLSVPIPDTVPIAALLPDISIACPLCRTENTRSEIRNIKGSSDTCSVCLDKEVDVYFLGCEHACVCRTCLVQL